jgi:hypothetical protein
MQALDYYVGVLSSKTSPAAVIMETICCLVTFTLSLPQWWHAAQHTFPPQLSSSSPWHTADFHPMMMLLFLLFPTTLLPFHLGSSSIQCTLQSSEITAATTHIVGRGPIALFVVLTNLFFFLFSWLAES